MTADLLFFGSEIEPPRAAQTFRRHSASVSVRWLTRTTAEIRYQGALCRTAFDALRAMALQATQTAASLVIRMDTALVLSVVMPAMPHEMYAGSIAPGCLVVPLDQYAQWAAHACELATMGVMRLVFVPSQQRDAYLMADSLAAMRVQSAASKPG